ncbi:hypothetical protein ONS95_004396 [Cadophora gregata]|uniref:uncharacterized protein n=1 Tax=Cadophora gregata TaxID=51156 RepID=UPI0026DC7921|nr:uncharacterized protein ONS95_004396 [Cadophora gregata]KAK0105209.1 hypothetical protein ONS96_004610 [Cadophora gregata f. sp. sojae]KAK0105884.1 hypothetical protein ONS95_004396 [Cadophora gregata]
MHTMTSIDTLPGYEDDWSVVQDPATRRRIQNRIAQRSHRLKYGRKPMTKRENRTSLREPLETHQNVQDKKRNKDSEVVATFEINNYPADSAHSLADLDISFLDSLDYQPNSSQEATLSGTLQNIESTSNPALDTSTVDSRVLESRPNTAVSTYQPPSPLTDQLIVVRALGTLSALLFNAAILQIDCHKQIRSREIYVPPTLSTPSALTPTPLQSTTPHLPYVDLIPFPSMRDRLLQSQQFISGVEIWADITRDITVWGNTPWDEGAWEIGERFAVKWWFLMDDEVLRGTNFWRGARDERRLSMGEIRERLQGGLLLVM